MKYGDVVAFHVPMKPWGFEGVAAVQYRTAIEADHAHANFSYRDGNKKAVIVDCTWEFDIEKMDRKENRSDGQGCRVDTSVEKDFLIRESHAWSNENGGIEYYDPFQGSLEEDFPYRG